MAKNATTKTKKRVPPALLVILDGFGLAPENNPGNAITSATAPNMFSYMKTFPSTALTAHGKDVGLFPKQEGNSEAGHFNIGAGRIVEQDLVRISAAIEDGTFFKNPAFEQAFFHAKKYKKAIHIMGLLGSNQSPHAHPHHLYAMIEYFRRKKYGPVYLHLFTDGRDSSPHSAIKHLRALRKHMVHGEQIATIMGRFYAMDRNKMWERTEQAFNTMVLGQGTCTAESAEEAISQAYNRGESDEYICPTVITENGKPITKIQDNDAIFFFNARSDRARQVTKAFVQPQFMKMNPGAFKRKRLPKNIRFVAMTDFGPDLPGIFTAFPSPDIDMCLARAIGEHRKQLYISETEKYAHVTYFVNGGYPEPINGEKRELVHSTGEYSYTKTPQMRSKKVTDTILSYFKKGVYDLVVVNFPNADMLGHTGNLEKAKEAVTYVDAQVKRLVEYITQEGGVALITADHGNAEEMIDVKTGEMMTEHTTNKVPCIVVGGGVKKLKKGRLADVAPTLLKLLGIKKPPEMTGKALF